ncbi:hypothetical protein [Qipengyuania sp. JC766]|uniref:hypothetical protein n=1 Tax=Qipengyuania sp. JC766 TaxID=3232139 RepID=UPI0034579BE5
MNDISPIPIFILVTTGALSAILTFAIFRHVLFRQLQEGQAVFGALCVVVGSVCAQLFNSGQTPIENFAYIVGAALVIGAIWRQKRPLG